MKRFVLWVLSLVILLSSSIIAFAEDFKTLTISGINVSIDIPSTWCCADRSLKDDNDPVCKYFGITSSEVIENLLDNETYFIAVDGSGNITLFFNIYEDDSEATVYFSDLSDAEITDYFRTLLNNFKGSSFKLIKYSVVRYSLPLFYTKVQTPSGDYVLDYSTVIAGNRYSFHLFIGQDSNNKSIENTAEQIAKSLKFPEKKIGSTNPPAPGYPGDGVQSYKFGDYFLFIAPDYYYTTRDDEDLDFSDNFVFENDYHVDCIVRYDGFQAFIQAYSKYYKEKMTDNQCLSEILKDGLAGFGVEKSFTAYALGDYKYVFVSDNDLGDSNVITYVNAFQVHKGGIIQIDSNHKCRNDKERENYFSFIMSLLDDVFVLEELPSD